jgi:flagellar hook-associated protein 2
LVAARRRERRVQEALRAAVAVPIRDGRFQQRRSARDFSASEWLKGRFSGPFSAYGGPLSEASRRGDLIMPTITFGGVGSGIDTESIISGLVSASRGPLTRVQQQKLQVESAVSSMSDLGNLLSKFKDAVSALDTIQEVGSFSATSDSKAVVATAAGGAQPGSFEIEVSQLASGYKAYSNELGISSAGEALGKSGTLGLSVNGENVDLSIDPTDTLDAVISKINASGLRVSASSFFDGSEYRLQLRGLDTGAENDVVVTETGTDFGFSDNVKSRGLDAELTIDGFEVTSKTNQVTGAISGVTLALTDVTTKTVDGVTTKTPANVSIASDAAGFQSKLKSLVDSYNGVINKIHADAGFGSIKASNPELSGDASLRSITSRLSSALTKTVGTGKFQTLRSIGIELNNDGTLKLNASTLEKALSEDPEAVTKVLAGDDKEVDGLADMLADIANDMLGANGVIQSRKDGLSSRQRLLTDRVDIEQARLDRMEEMLRKQFTEMDSVVASTKAQSSFLGG